MLGAACRIKDSSEQWPVGLSALGFRLQKERHRFGEVRDLFGQSLAPKANTL